MDEEKVITADDIFSKSVTTRFGQGWAMQIASIGEKLLYTAQSGEFTGQQTELLQAALNELSSALAAIHGTRGDNRIIGVAKAVSLALTTIEIFNEAGVKVLRRPKHD